MLGVGSVLEARDFDLLSARFKRDFDTFALLNEVAIEACNAVGFSITNLGVIDESELSVRPHVLLTCPFWD